MKKKITIVAIAVLALAALISLKVYAATPKASKPQIWTPGCVASVPKSWGTFRGASSQSGLAFEDSAGTIRFLTNIPCGDVPIVSLEVRRTPSNLNGGNQ